MFAEEYGDYFEGDMLLTEAQRKEIENAKMSDEDNEDNTPKNGLIYAHLRWPNNTVVYDIVEGDFNKEQKRMFEDGLQEIAGKSCVRFRRRKSKDEYAAILQGKRDGCYSDVGYNKADNKKNQRINLSKNCFVHGTIVHEILHTIGFFHMQSTYDRDDYVTIFWENIETGKESNFAKYTNRTVTDFGLPYDYGSVMHYGEKAFSKNGQNTMTPKKDGAKIGQRKGLSKSDSIKLNKMYNCPKEETTTARETIMDWNFLNGLPKPWQYLH
ncbi:unnamed protein product [Arctia plantaginis]|uniref:Metalloendopeptidase n=1 Tax=Arctia plantaginis TaxID=874455 RepID=A0A8S1BKU6_ARCPL|nr:unnamed protein product [Arctia plantaginis]